MTQNQSLRMTPEEKLKQLTKFSIKFFEQSIVLGIAIDRQTLFYEDTTAPILVHLAQEMLEKHGWRWKVGVFYKGDSKYSCQLTRAKYKESNPYYPHEFDANKFIVFWLSVYEAMEK